MRERGRANTGPNQIAALARATLVVVNGKGDSKVKSIFEKVFSGGTSSAVADFEHRNKIVLPDDYRQFLIERNGGLLNLLGIFIADVNQPVIVNVLFGLTGIRGTDLQADMDEMGDEMPDGFIMIGHDPGGNLILMSTKTKAGIYYWDCMRAFAESSDDKNAYLLCRTFTEFLNLLSENPGGFSLSD